MIVDLCHRHHRPTIVVDAARLAYLRGLLGLPELRKILFPEKLLLLFLSKDDSLYCSNAAANAWLYAAHRVLVDDKLCHRLWGTTSSRREYANQMFSIARGYRSVNNI
jgi:hypothetical protein